MTVTDRFTFSPHQRYLRENEGQSGAFHWNTNIDTESRGASPILDAFTNTDQDLLQDPSLGITHLFYFCVQPGSG